MCATSSSSTAASSTGPAGGASTTCSRPTASTSASCRTRRSRSQSDVAATHSVLDAAGRPGDPRRPLLRRRRHHRGRHATKGRRTRLHRGVRARQGRVRQHPDRRPAARARRCRRSCRPQDGFLFLDRDEVPDSFAADLPARATRRSWPTRRSRGASTRSAARSPSRLAQQAELVPGRHRRPDDPAAGAARHVRARRLDRRRGARQPLGLRLAAAGGRRPDQAGRAAGPRRDPGGRRLAPLPVVPDGAAGPRPRRGV